MSSTVVTALMSGAIAIGSVVAAHAQQSGGGAGQAAEANRLLGTWQVVSFKAITGDQVSYPMGEHPAGFLGITRSRVWIMLVDSTRKAPATATLTDVEALALMRSSIAYTAKYDLDPIKTEDGVKMTQHVDTASNEALVGTDRVFFMGVDDNKLSVRSPSVVVPTSGLRSSVQVEFVRVD